MMKQRIRVLLNVGPAGFRLDGGQRKRLLKACPRAVIIVKKDDVPLDEFDGHDVDALVTEEVPRNLAAWPRLRFVQSMASGIDYLRDHPVWKTRIAVCNASGTHSVPIAQYITCAWLLMAHRMPELLPFRSTRRWPDREALAGFVVRGMSAGIVGYGSIGREAARQLAALGMRIVCLKRNPSNRRDEGYNPWPGTGDPEGKLPERWFAPAQVGRMLPLCDLVVVTAPRTAETIGLIGKRELRCCKKGARLIIASRGGVVDEPALAEALCRGHLAGAVVDSFVQEPLATDHVFFDTPNLVLTSHMSGVYQPYWPHAFPLFCENLRRFSRGRKLLNRVDGSLGY